MKNYLWYTITIRFWVKSFDITTKSFNQVPLLTPKSSTSEIFENDEAEKVPCFTKDSESGKESLHAEEESKAPEVKTKRLGSKRSIRKELPSIQEEYQLSNDVEVGSYKSH